MKNIMLFMVAALAWVVTACSKDEAVINNNENLIKEISLVIEGSDSRVSYTPDATGLKFEWEDGNRVIVLPAEANNHAAVEFKYNKSSEKFVSNTGLEAGKKYYAIHDFTQKPADCNVGGVSAGLLHAANGNLGSLPMVSDIFTATAEGTISTLRHTCGVVEIPFTGSGTLSNVDFNAFNSTSDKLVRGKFTVSFTDDGKVGTITRGQYQNNCTYITESTTYLGDPLTLSATPQSLFIPLLPGTYNNVKIKNNDKTVAENLSVTVERGKVHKKAQAINVE